MGQTELIMEDEEDKELEPMIFVPLPKTAEIVDGAIKIPACLACTMAINILIQRDMMENA